MAVWRAKNANEWAQAAEDCVRRFIDKTDEELQAIALPMWDDLVKYSNKGQYGKFIRKSKKYAVHDPDNRFKVGDAVRIRECRPLSRTKRWEVLADGA